MSGLTEDQRQDLDERVTRIEEMMPELLAAVQEHVAARDADRRRIEGLELALRMSKTLAESALDGDVAAEVDR